MTKLKSTIFHCTNFFLILYMTVSYKFVAAEDVYTNRSIDDPTVQTDNSPISKPSLDLEAPHINHNPVGEYIVVGGFFLIRAIIADNEGVKIAHVYYRFSKDEKFRKITLEPTAESDLYIAILKIGDLVSGDIEYFISAEDHSGNTAIKGITSPLTTFVDEPQFYDKNHSLPSSKIESKPKSDGGWLGRLFGAMPPKDNINAQGNDGSSRQISSHVWQSVSRDTSKIAKYGMYTFVLFGINPEKLPHHEDTFQQYNSLLNAILVSTENSGEVFGLPKVQTNIFHIPVKDEDILPNIDNYDISLSLVIQHKVKNQLSNESYFDNNISFGKGPFLVTFLPIDEQNNQQEYFLYADLSSTNPGAMKELVAAYKVKLSRDRVNSLEKFKSLRLSLLNYLLNADDAIILVREAISDIVE